MLGRIIQTRGNLPVASRVCFIWELPDDHPARMDGAMGDLLVLGADDRLVLRQ
jgi:hypothetical protein